MDRIMAQVTDSRMPNIVAKEPKGYMLLDNAVS